MSVDAPGSSVLFVGFIVAVTSFTLTELIVKAAVPVFFTLSVTFVYAGAVPVHVGGEIIFSSYDFMNVNVRAPIHAATAMLTATVTAISMIDATTGLRAFLLFNIFIFFFIPPFGVIVYVRGANAFKSYDLIHHINRL